jgi:hypothetical protein
MIFEQVDVEKSRSEIENSLVVQYDSLQPVACLDISNVSLTRAQVALLATYITWNDQLEVLNLWGCNIHQYLDILIPCFLDNVSLFHIDLGGNGIDDGGAKMIAGFIKQSKTLYSIELGCNLITDVGLEPLVNALCVNTTLGEFHFADNPITSTGAQYLVSHLDRLGPIRISRLQEEYEQTIPYSITKELEMFNFNSFQIERGNTPLGAWFVSLARKLLILDLPNDVKYEIASKASPYEGYDGAIVLKTLLDRTTLGLIIRAKFSFTELIRMSFAVNKPVNT